MHAIQFSGGVDSLAVLWLLREYWPHVHVFWCNTGAAYDSTREYMERVRKLVPNFHEVRSDQPQVIELYGWPVDVVPVSHTKLGHLCCGTQGRLFQNYMDCCARSIWHPLDQAMRAHGVTHVYRGQRSDESRKAPIHDGHTEAGITYHFPVERWTRAQVLDYCEANCAEWMPPYYREGERTSRDCWNCTAYRDDNAERVAALPTERRAVVEQVLHDWRVAVAREMH